MLLLSETHVTNEIGQQEIEIPGYDVIRNDSSSRFTGGVVIYISNSLKWSLISNVHRSKTWITAIDIHTNEYAGRYCIIYKSPREKINDFIEILDDFLGQFAAINNNFVLIGDVNINVLKRKDKNVKKYLELLTQHNLHQLINEPTRTTAKSSTCIDHLITNNRKTNWRINENTVTDHFMIEFSQMNKYIRKKKREDKYVIIKSFKNYDKCLAADMIDKANWIQSDCIECVTHNLNENLCAIANHFIKFIKIKKNAPLIFNDTLKRIKQELLIAKKKYFFEKTSASKFALTQLNKKFKNEIRAVKDDRIKASLKQHAHEPKKLWKILNKLQKNTSNEFKSITTNNMVITNASEIANLMNSFFVSSIEEIVNNIPSQAHANFVLNIEPTQHVFSLNTIGFKQIKTSLKKLKNKSFNDNVNGFMLCDLIDNEGFMRHLLKVINMSIQIGIMPDEYKVAVVTPIPKINNPETPEHYRGINNLPLVEKLIEDVVHEQLTSYLEKNKLLVNEQSGYRKYHSTESAIQCVLFDWFDAIENNLCIIVVSLDFKRAYETISRTRLIEKCKHFGFDENALHWLESYLLDRKQHTVVNGAFSDVINVKHGVPQGSKLAAILFIMYINDLINNLPSVKINLYADDSLVYLTCRDESEGIKVLNEALDKIYDWLCENSMAINTKKCSYMIINSNNNDIGHDVMMNNVAIERVKYFKYLGCFIDEKLNFETHFNKVKASISQKVGFLRRIKHKLTRSSRILFVKSVIVPHLNYASSILFMFNNERLASIQRTVNRALRVALSRPNDASVEGLIRDCGIMTVKNLVNFNSLKFIHNVNKRGAPQLLYKKFKFNYNRHNRMLRNKNCLDLPSWIKEKHRNTIFFKGVAMLNDLYKNYNEEYTFKTNYCKFVNI
jgi:hypothetical protein